MTVSNIIFVYPESKDAVRKIPGFRDVSEYGTLKPVDDNEIGGMPVNIDSDGEVIRFIIHSDQ